MSSFSIADINKDFLTWVPRFGGESEFSPSDPTYVQNTLMTSVFGLIGAGCVVLSFIIFWFARYCWDSCGSQFPTVEDNGYSPPKRWTPFVILVILSGIFTGGACYILVNGTEFHNSLVGDTGIASAGSSLLTYSQSYFIDLIEPLEELVNNTDIACTQVLEYIGDLSSSPLTTDQLTQYLNYLSLTYNNLEVVVQDSEANDVYYNLTYCWSPFSTRITDLSDQIQSQVSDTFSQISETRLLIQNTIISLQSEITTSSQAAIPYLEDATYTIEIIKNETASAINFVNDYNVFRNFTTIILMFFPIVFTGFVFGSCCIKSPKWMNTMWVFSFLATLVYFIIFAIHFPSAIFVVDICKYLETEETDLSSLTGMKITKILCPIRNRLYQSISGVPLFDSCLNDVNLKDVLNLTQALNFSSVIDFPEVNMTLLLDLPIFTYILSEVDILDLTTFGYDSVDRIDNPLFQVNDFWDVKVAGLYFDRTNISDLDPSDYDPGSEAYLAPLRLSILNAISEETGLIAELGDFIIDVNNFAPLLVELRGNLSYIETNMTLAEQAINPVLTPGNEIDINSDCTVLGNDYLEIKESFCQGGVKSSIIIVIISFFMGILGIPIIVLSIISAKRLPHPIGWEDDLEFKRRREEEKRDSRYPDDTDYADRFDDDDDDYEEPRRRSSQRRGSGRKIKRQRGGRPNRDLDDEDDYQVKPRRGSSKGRRPDRDLDDDYDDPTPPRRKSFRREIEEEEDDYDRPYPKKNNRHFDDGEDDYFLS